MKTVTLSTLQAYKRAGETFSCLTAYDASFAHAASAAGIDVLLVGDSWAWFCKAIAALSL